MHTKENQKKTKGVVVFGFPGMGKTTTALHLGGVIDLDFGMFREALKVPKERETTILLPFSRLMKYYFNDGYIVLTNEPGLIPLVKQFAEGNIVMVLPDDDTLRSYSDRIYSRAKMNPNHHFAFAKTLADNKESWVLDWTKLANTYHIPVLETRYLGKEVIDAIRR